jgi:hypothetical protein
MGSVFVAKDKAFGYLWHITIPSENCYHEIKIRIEHPFKIFDCCTGCDQDNVYEGTVIVESGSKDIFTFTQTSNAKGADL